MPSDQRLTYTVEETAELMGVSLSAAYKCIRRGELPSIHIGRRVLVPRKALESMLDEAASFLGSGLVSELSAQSAPRRSGVTR